MGIENACRENLPSRWANLRDNIHAMRRYSWASRHVVGPLLLLGAMGCGSSPTEVGEVPRSIQNLKQIGTAYLDAMARLERPPKNVEELKPSLKKFGDPAVILRS